MNFFQRCAALSFMQIISVNELNKVDWFIKV